MVRQASAFRPGFQSTRPHGARPATACGSQLEPPGFNPRARTGRDDFQPFDCGLCVGVSIHAPARGATAVHHRGRRLRRGFNPRARTGRDAWKCTVPLHVVSFQSTRPHGARPLPPSAPHQMPPVSIHAPARGATPPLLWPWLHAGVSIHAPARGATQATAQRLPPCWCFNPRARTGRDTRRCTVTQRRAGFNPRARTGRDMALISCSIRSRSVSIHAPARGATGERAAGAGIGAVSIHAPARGATARRFRRSRRVLVSIHAPARGATFVGLFLLAGCSVSIHAPARGATHRTGTP